MSKAMNPICLDQLCAALAYATGVDTPSTAAPADPRLVEYVDKALGSQKADRLIMYNPDAIAQWIYEKYPEYMKKAIAKAKWRSRLGVWESAR